MEQVVSMTQDRMQNIAWSQDLKSKWTDWKWQIQHAVKDIDTVERILNITFNEQKRKQIETTIEKFPISVTPYYLSLIDTENYEDDPIFKQAFPDIRELTIKKTDMIDPLSEERDSPTIGVTHRYPDRVLFHVSNVCAMYCRHCTRKRKVGDRDCIPSKQDIEKGLNYIRNTPVIRDVLLSGGDPFMLSDEYLDWILGELDRIPHVEIVRIGTRTPVVLPFRITESLTDVLKRHGTIWINTHFNHPREITKSSKAALKKLAMAGIPLGNQSVLLADVNDCPKIIKKLVHKLVENRVRPYYLYQCDLSEGLEHFRTPIGKGIEIMESLIGHTSGFAVPTYVIDAPGGGGKIPVMPNYLISRSTNKAVLRNYEGVITTYKEPDQYDHTICNLDCDACNLSLDLDEGKEVKSVGIARLLSHSDEKITITPNDLRRKDKR